MGFNHEKNWRLKIRWHTPLKGVCHNIFGLFLHDSNLEILRNLTVCIAPRSQSPWCSSHRGVKLHTAESELKMSLASAWLLLKGQSGEIILSVNTSIMREKIWITKCWFAKSKILTPRFHAHRGDRIFQYLGEIEIEFENTSACVYQGPAWIPIMEKNVLPTIILHKLKIGKGEHVLVCLYRRKKCSTIYTQAALCANFVMALHMTLGRGFYYPLLPPPPPLCR